LQLEKMILEAAGSGVTPGGESYLGLSIDQEIELARKTGRTRREIQLAALGAGVVPERYQRNLGTIGLEGQIALLNSRAAVIGAGGLGGLVVELLARMGVGYLVVVDGDRFAESNLNRQLLSVERNLGRLKARVAARRARRINGAVEVKAVAVKGDRDNLPGLIEGCSVVLDCLDNLPSRFEVEEACQRAGVPLVHGAVAGFMGQLAVIEPGRPLFPVIYSDPHRGGGRGAETRLGNPAATPAMVASWQVNEAVKIITGKGEVLRGKLLVIDMFSGDLSIIKLSG